MKLYNFGADVRSRKPETLKALSWPVYAWACYIPENLSPNLNILEKLILSLVDKGIATTEASVHEILVRQLGLNADLLSNVLEVCTNKYFNKSFKKELVLKEDAKKLLVAIEDGISPEMEMSDSTKKVYLFQDAVTNTVIPCFNIDTLPPEFEGELFDDQNCITLRDLRYELPKTSAISNAVFQWGRILKKLDTDDQEDSSNLDLSSTDDEFADAREIPPVASDHPKTLAEAENSKKRIDTITVFDDEPALFQAVAYIAFDPSNLDEVEIISPFGKVFNNWFMKLLNKIRLSNQSIADELSFFLEERKDAFKGQIAYGNDLSIQLFDDYPSICNDVKYADLKKAIQSLYKDITRIKGGEDESTNFAKNLRTAIEVLFRTAIREQPELGVLKGSLSSVNKTGGFQQQYNAYLLDLRRLVETNGLSNEIYHRYRGQKIFENMISPWQSNPKDNAALILLYASKHSDSAAMDLVIDFDYIFVEMPDLYRLGTDAVHAGTNYTTMYFSVTEVDQYYLQFENMTRAIFDCLIKGAE